MLYGGKDWVWWRQWTDGVGARMEGFLHPGGQVTETLSGGGGGGDDGAYS